MGVNWLAVALPHVEVLNDPSCTDQFLADFHWQLFCLQHPDRCLGHRQSRDPLLQK
jgi:hypothetical protein